MYKKVKNFYEVQQGGGVVWNTVGFFLSLEKAQEYEGRFNTKVVVYPTRIIEREFKDVE
jgi:hypothetical protein